MTDSLRRQEMSNLRAELGYLWRDVRDLQIQTNSDETLRRTLEDLTDRACSKGAIPLNMGLSEFVNWLRGLYPDLYKSLDEMGDKKCQCDQPTLFIKRDFEGFGAWVCAGCGTVEKITV